MNSTCVIIPCYNEGYRLDLEAYLSHNGYDILLVNDGSDDNTKGVTHNLAVKNIYISNLQLPENVGKAEAIRQGVFFLKGNYETIGYLDADLSTSLQEMKRLIDTHITGGYHLTMGSRLKIAGSRIKRFWWRHFSGRIIATIIDGFFLKSGIYDTQCGAKVMNNKTALLLFKEPFETRWLFDVELLLRLKKIHGKERFSNLIREVPLTQWIDDGDSRIRFKDMLQLPVAFFRIYKRYL